MYSIILARRVGTAERVRALKVSENAQRLSQYGSERRRGDTISGPFNLEGEIRH
jgi:hypothetical protein